MFRRIKRFITFILIVIIAILGYETYNGYNLYKESVENTSIQEKVNEIQSSDSYVSLDNVSNYFCMAIVDVEDRRFYSHFGIDIYSQVRAFVNNIKSGKITGGGSTITRQLAKNLYFSSEQKLSRKFAEVFMALELEEKYSKDEILEMYINVIYFGNGYYGIKEASNGYLDKEPSTLDLNEASLLAGIPNAPSVYALTNNAKVTYERQKMVLDAMLDANDISKEEYDSCIEIVNENIKEAN